MIDKIPKIYIQIVAWVQAFFYSLFITLDHTDCYTVDFSFAGDIEMMIFINNDNICLDEHKLKNDKTKDIIKTVKRFYNIILYHII